MVLMFRNVFLRNIMSDHEYWFFEKIILMLISCKASISLANLMSIGQNLIKL